MVRATKLRVRTRKWSFTLLEAGILAVILVFSGATQARNNFNPRSRQPITRGEKLEAEQLLANMAYWTGPVDGTLDPAFRQALIAFQKVERRKLSGQLTREELRVIRSATKPLPRHTGYFHVEIDLQRQILFVVDASDSITHILPISSGNEKLYRDQGQVHRAHTPRGSFKVLRQIKGWRRSTLGLLYYPSYIVGGIAVHGASSVPTYAASHGCIRIPMHAAKELSVLMPVGTAVVVYD